MKILSIEAFVPSGADFNRSKLLFQELGFYINWEQPDCAGLQSGDCRFILQDYNQPGFAENFMLSVKVDDIAAFGKMVAEKKLVEQYGIRVSNILKQPYGKEINIIDLAGVCWHFIQQ